MYIRTYSELITLPTFEERFEYLKLDGFVGRDTFGSLRYLNQNFYRSKEWTDFRRQIIIRDNGCDLGVEGYEIYGKILIHHINPLSQEDVARMSIALLDPENVICISHQTHNAIHYGNEKQIQTGPVVRRPNDTTPWKRG